MKEERDFFEGIRELIEEEERKYQEKFLRDVKAALERGATRPSPCKKSWRDRFDKPSEEEK